MTSLLSKYKRYWPLALVIVLGVYNAFGNAFMQDDAYISYNYAKWFSRGYGLVWYPNSTEFGFTSFLYTFMIGVAMLFGIPPEWASNSINMASFVVCLVLVFHLSKRLLTSSWLAVIPVLLLATHHTFTAYATGGLETMWVTMLILAFYWRILTHAERDAAKNYIVIGTLAAVALLSRLDTAILLFFGYVYLVLCHCEPRRSDSEGGRSNPWRIGLQRCLDCFVLLRNPRNDVWAAVIIPTITTLGFLLVCYIAYGYALPNTFYIKMPGGESMTKYGLRYLWLYNMLHLYLPLFVPLLMLYFFAKRDLFKRLGASTLLLASVLLIWLCYIVYVGGDFMEFRFLVPVLGFYYIVIIRLIQALIPKYTLHTIIGITCAFLLGNALHPTLFATNPNVLDFNQVPKKFEYAYVESTDSLEQWLIAPKTNWRIIGKAMHNLFHASQQKIKIATGNTGILPFYSDMNVFDILGLNSRAVLESHKFDILRPGHMLLASDALIISQKINLNLAFPHNVCRVEKKYVFVNNPATSFPYKRHQTLFVPLGNGCYVVADYITRHPKIDSLINQKVIIRYRDVAKQTSCPDWLCLR